MRSCYPGLGGQLLYTICVYLVLRWPAQHFSPLREKHGQGAIDDSVLIEGHLHNVYFLPLLCPSQVDMPGQHRPRELHK